MEAAWLTLVPLAGSALRAVLLDAGNTLIHMPRSAEEILQEACGDLGRPINAEQARSACRRSEQYYVEHYLGYAGDQGEFWLRYHGEALRELGIDDTTGEKAAYLSHRFGRADVWAAYSDAADSCARLKAMGLKLGVVSNGSVTVNDLLSQAGLLGFFDVVVASQAVGIQKPDPRIFANALDALAISPEQALFVGDLYEVDVVGAEAAGMAAVLIDRDGNHVDAACAVVRGLDELVGMLSSV